jgi:hypothetical protein
MLFSQRQVVTKDYVSHLPYLIRLGFSFSGLQIKDLFDRWPREDVMIASYPFNETELLEQLTEVPERDIRVTTTHQDVLQQLLVSIHTLSVPAIFILGQSDCQPRRFAAQGDKVSRNARASDS